MASGDKRKPSKSVKRQRQKNRYVGATLFVVRITSDNCLVNAKPCMVCLNMIKNSGIKRVLYSNEFGNITMEKVKDMTSTTLSHSQEANHICVNKKWNI